VIRPWRYMAFVRARIALRVSSVGGFNWNWDDTPQRNSTGKRIVCDESIANACYAVRGRLTVVFDFVANGDISGSAKIHDLGVANEDIGSQLPFSGLLHSADSDPSGYRRSRSKGQSEVESPQSTLSRFCHAILGAHVGVVMGFVAGLLLLGWYLILVAENPFTGVVVLLLSALAFGVNQREAERRFCGEVREAHRQHKQSEDGQADADIFRESVIQVPPRIEWRSI